MKVLPQSVYQISRATGLGSELMPYLGAFESKDDLLGGLGLLVEDGFGLTTVSRLLSVVTTLTLSEDGVFTLLVLGDLKRFKISDQMIRFHTLKVECLFSDLLNVFRVFGTLTMPTSV